MAASTITCHVLNTLTGTPASDLKVVLTLLGSNPFPPGAAPGVIEFHAATDQDGRVKAWQPNTTFSVQDVMDKLAQGNKAQSDKAQSDKAQSDKAAWSLRFSIGAWYEERKIECFWPEIEVKFYVEHGRRYHVPLLVGPWTYTTYRGS